jgi:hypothetical protein
VSDDLETVIRTMTAEALIAAHKRVSRRFLIAAVATMACVAAGIWIDLRWLPTAILPLAVAISLGYLAHQYWSEINRRIEERQRETQ